MPTSKRWPRRTAGFTSREGLVEYALADAFGDYPADQDFFARGSAIADNLADGTTPELVRGFKQRLIAVARDPKAAAKIAARLPDAVDR